MPIARDEAAWFCAECDPGFNWWQGTSFWYSSDNPVKSFLLFSHERALLGRALGRRLAAGVALALVAGFSTGADEPGVMEVETNSLYESGHLYLRK